METEFAVARRLEDLALFLEHEDTHGIIDIEVYEHAVIKYELLHAILENKGEPRWCS